MMRSPAWSNRFFGEEEQKLTSSENTELTEGNRIQLRIELPIVRENDAGVPYSTTYYSIPQRQKWFFRVAQCRSKEDFYTLYHDLEEEDAYLGQLQKSMIGKIQAYAEPTNTQEYDVIHQQISKLIEVTRERLTLIEMDYHFALSEHQISSPLRLVEKDYAGKMHDALSYLAMVYPTNVFCGLVLHDAAKILRLRRTLFSIFSSLRNTNPFAALEEAEDILSESPTFLRSLTSHYYACFIDDIESFNIDYFKQIIGEELQTTLNLYHSHNYIYPEPFYFKMSMTSADAHCKIADVYFKRHEYKTGLMHLIKATEYGVDVATKIYGHLEISHNAPFGNTLPEDMPSGLPQLQLLAMGSPRIKELGDRMISIKTLKETINMPLDNCLCELEELAKTDQEIWSMMRELTTEILYIDQLVPLNKTLEVAQQIHEEFDQIAGKAEEALPNTPAISVAEVKSEKAKVRKQKLRQVKNPPTAQREIPYPTLPAILPVLTYTPPIEIKETLTKEPTIRISDEEIGKNKKLKQQRYEEEKKKADILAQQEAAKTGVQDPNLFEYEFNSVISEKVIKSRLDYQACIRTMGELAFYKLLPELQSLLEEGREAGMHGTGIKFVSRSEKRAMGLPENAYCFKLKPSNHKVRIYGMVVKENGEDTITFNMPRYGKLHDTVAHLPKFRK